MKANCDDCGKFGITKKMGTLNLCKGCFNKQLEFMKKLLET